MALFKYIRTTCSVLLAFSLVVLIVSGCSQETVTNPFQDDSDSNSGTFEKKIKTYSTSTTSTGDYPQTGSCVMYYEPYFNAYDGGNFTVKNGSSFTVGWASLTPPAGTPTGANITVHMTVEKNSSNNALLFSFGPSGCQFNPAAEIWLRWKDLGGGGIPNLYYIDNSGNLIPQTPEDIDQKGKRLLVRVSHFSRYAVAFSQ
jgi:hypothetical protein